MVRIRLQRRGRHKRPIHHIVVADSREPRDGRIIEDLGRFNNLTSVNEVSLDEERAIYWLKQGAQPSDTVRSIFKHQGILYKMHLIRWDKSEEEIEEALAEWRENHETKQKEPASPEQKQKALLEAEEKEYQKQLKKKAEEAAKERAKQEALEEAEAKEAQQAKEAEEKPEEAAEESEEASTGEAQAAEESAEAAEKEPVEEEAQAAGKQDQPEDAETAKEEQQAESGEEPEDKTAPSKEESETGGGSDQVSSDMLAKDAIKHIEETPLDELRGFISDDESRVTVKRALEEKQEEESS
jgi:small subunit ribosomal protein S16